MMKKMLAIIGFIILLRATLVPSFAQTAILSYGEKLEGYRLEIVGTDGSVTDYEFWPLYMDDQLAWCLDMLTWTIEHSNYTRIPGFDYLSPELIQDLELICYLAWTSSAKQPEDYVATQLLLWERLGFEWADTTLSGQPNPQGFSSLSYAQRRDRLQTQLAELRQISRYEGAKFELMLGETLTLPDSEGFLKQLLGDQTPTHVQIEYSPGELRLTGISVGSEHLTFDRFLAQDRGESFFWLSDDGHQDVATLAVGTPLATQFEVEVIEPRGRVKLRKHGSSGEALAGATFALYSAQDELIQSAQSDETGELIFEDLALGEYYLIEVSPPPGYIRSDEPIHFTIHGSELIELESENKPNRIEFVKLDAQAKPLSGAHLQLLDENGVLIDEWDSEKSPKVWQALIPGQYQIVEQAAPPGYSLTEPITFEITSETKELRLEMVNQPVVGELEISKFDISTADPLPNTRIEIYTEAEEMIAAANTDSQGLVRFTQLPVGKYYFIEREAPLGYVIDEQRHPFEITQHGEIIKSSLSNQKIRGSLRIRKKALHSGETLAGVKFRLLYPDGTMEYYVTDARGEIHVVLDYGSYLLDEVTPLEGYAHPERYWEFAIDEPEQLIELEITNTQLTKEKPKLPATGHASQSWLLALSLGLSLGGMVLHKRK